LGEKIMALASVDKADSQRTGKVLIAAITDRGSAGHPYASSDDLLHGPDSSRNLADAIHFLCALHGRHPGVIDHAANRPCEPEARKWLEPAREAFATERQFLARLAVAVGPVPSTPGAGDSDGVLKGQRHAINMLAQSERRGCALGAALALAGDWSAIRTILEIAAERLNIALQPFPLSPPSALAPVADAAASGPAAERAILFGAEQILLQHHGLWDLLEARKEARAG
jgi:hypothetical protein